MQDSNFQIKLVIFSVMDNALKVFQKDGVLPYGSELSKGFDSEAKRIFEKETKIKLDDLYLEQLYTFSAVMSLRAPIKSGRGNPVGIHDDVDIILSYYLLVPAREIPSENLAKWIAIEKISKNHSDFEIINYACKRLRWKVEYTNIVYSLLPPEFTLSELQSSYEAILGKELDKRNFRRKILSLGILTTAGKKKEGMQARPALMYRFKIRKLQMVKVF